VINSLENCLAVVFYPSLLILSDFLQEEVIPWIVGLLTGTGVTTVMAILLHRRFGRWLRFLIAVANFPGLVSRKSLFARIILRILLVLIRL
jgi:hypothetical protein